MSFDTVLDNTTHFNSNVCSINKNQSHFNNEKIITRYEVEKIIKDAVPSNIELVDYRLYAFSEEKIGFLGDYFCLDFILKESKSNVSSRKSFFVKTIPYHVPSQVTYIEEKGAFQKEYQFFKYLMPLLLENFEGETWAPQCFLSKESTIVLEDLRMKGFSNRAKIFDEVTIKSAAACVARFHSCSLLAEEKLNGKHLNEIYPNICQESEYKLNNRNYTWFTTAINLAVSIAEDLGLNANAIRTASHRVFEIGRPSRNKRNVLSHGDLWSNNMLFDDNNRCNLVDFQLLRYAPLAHDVTQLLYLTTCKEFREKYERDIVEHYFSALMESLKINNYQGIKPSFEEVLQGVEEQKFPALVTAMINFPTIMIDSKIGARIMNSLEVYESYFFNDRSPFVNQIMTLDPEYERRIKEVVKELAEMSLKINSLPHAT